MMKLKDESRHEPWSWQAYQPPKLYAYVSAESLTMKGFSYRMENDYDCVHEILDSSIACYAALDSFNPLSLEPDTLKGWFNSVALDFQRIEIDALNCS